MPPGGGGRACNTPGPAKSRPPGPPERGVAAAEFRFYAFAIFKDRQTLPPGGDGPGAGSGQPAGPQEPVAGGV